MLRRLFTVLGLLLILGNMQIALAHDVLQGDHCTVAADEHIKGDVFALCRDLIVSGEIGGNLFGAASTIQIDGKVNGSLYLVGGQLDISGAVGKDIHFAGGVLNLKPSAQLTNSRADLITISLSTQVDAPLISGSVTSVSYQLVLNGAVGGEVSFWGSALTINNVVSGDVTATVGDPASTGVTELHTLINFLPADVDLINPGLHVTETGMINGQLSYSGPVEGEIEATLPNPPIYTPFTAQPELISPEKSLGESLRDYLSQAMRDFVSLLLIGIGGLFLVPRTLQAPIYSLRFRPLPSLGIGLLTFMLSFPIFFIVVPLIGAALVLLLLLLQLSDLALIAGAIVLVIDLGGMGVFYFTAIMVSRVIVCIALGRIVVRLLFGERPERIMGYVSLLIGVVALALVSSLPYVGFVINALAAFFGLGAILMFTQRQIELAREAASIPPVPTFPEEARQLPPPAIDDKLLAPGADNLPEGFHWWN